MFDHRRLRELRKEVARFGTTLDPNLLTADAADQLVDEAAMIESIAATIKALAALRSADGGRWRARGARSPAHDFARRTGMGVGQAKSLLDTASRLTDQPALSEAVRNGEVSSSQAAAIADAAASNPGAEKRLVATAKRKAPLPELRDECGKAKAAADPNPEETHRRLHATRSCRKRTTTEGMGEIIYCSTLDEIGEVWSVIGGHARRRFDAARKAGRRESHDTYAADGMLDMARAAAARKSGSSGGCAEPSPVRPERIIVRIDWDALIRGWPADGEVSEIPGIGPVAVSAVRAMMATGDAFLAGVVTKGKDVATVVHLGRQPTTYQDTALLWRDPYCTNEACDAVFGLQRDHRHDWAETKVTLVGWMDRLCAHDHNLKTRENWALVQGTGRRAFVPPHDPRHPKHAMTWSGAPRDGPREGRA